MRVKKCDQCCAVITGPYLQSGDSTFCGPCGEKLMKHCASCHARIEAQYVQLRNGDCYHAQCLHCTRCKRQMDASLLNEAPGGFKCHDCIRADLPKCAGCRKAVESEALQIGDEIYHTNCFKCHKCNKPTTNTTRDDVGPLCQSCEPQCGKCKKPLRGPFIQAEGMTCHPECFRCVMCNTPLKEHYNTPKGPTCAKCSVVGIQKEEDAKNHRDDQRNMKLLRDHERKYKLSWNPSEREESASVLAQLNMKMGNDVGIKLDTGVRVAEVRPEANVNLAYLATALSIIEATGAEPKFSLDPANVKNIAASEFQVKVFYPTFMENTPYGEILFQADFVLKKLAFGEISIPGVDLHPANAVDDKPFMARQWFVVREASVDVSQDGFLIPRVTMGVECREIMNSPTGVKDAPSTDPTSHFVKHAQKVTEHFSEIARRIPVIAELIEVARATILARYLIEKGAKVDRKVLEKVTHPAVMKSYEKKIPTIVKKQHYSTVRNTDGVVLTDKRIRTVHGGVDLSAPKKIMEATGSARTRVSAPRSVTQPLPLFQLADAA